MPVFLNFTIKDWLIAITSFILILCMLEIRRLKKSIAQKIHKQTLPQLILEFVSGLNVEDAGLYLKNESFFLARDIRIEDVELTLDDLGYKLGMILKFEDIDFIKPKERVKLKLKVFDRDQRFLPDVTEKIIPHLAAASFSVKIHYSNIENLKSHIIFSKKEGNFIPKVLKQAGNSV